MQGLPSKPWVAACRHAVPGNREFCIAVAQWLFHERGLLRPSNMRHHKVGETERPEAYRVSDELEFSLDLQELVQGRWQPYQ